MKYLFVISLIMSTCVFAERAYYTWFDEKNEPQDIEVEDANDEEDEIENEEKKEELQHVFSNEKGDK